MRLQSKAFFAVVTVVLGSLSLGACANTAYAGISEIKGLREDLSKLDKEAALIREEMEENETKIAEISAGKYNDSEEYPNFSGDCESSCLAGRGACTETVFNLLKIEIDEETKEPLDDSSCVAIYKKRPTLAGIPKECREKVLECGWVARKTEIQKLTAKNVSLEAKLRKLGEQRELKDDDFKAAVKACPNCLQLEKMGYRDANFGDYLLGGLLGGGGIQFSAGIGMGGGGMGYGISNPYLACAMYGIPCSGMGVGAGVGMNVGLGYNPYGMMYPGLTAGVGYNPYMMGYNPYAGLGLTAGIGFNPYGMGYNPYAGLTAGVGFNPYMMGYNPYAGLRLTAGVGFNPYAMGSNPYAGLGLTAGVGFNPYAMGYNPYAMGYNPYAMGYNPYASTVGIGGCFPTPGLTFNPYGYNPYLTGGVGGMMSPYGYNPYMTGGMMTPGFNPYASAMAFNPYGMMNGGGGAMMNPWGSGMAVNPWATGGYNPYMNGGAGQMWGGGGAMNGQYQSMMQASMQSQMLQMQRAQQQQQNVMLSQQQVYEAQMRLQQSRMQAMGGGYMGM